VSDLPGILAEIAALVGPDAARRIGLRLAGQVVKFPCRAALVRPDRDAEIRRLFDEGWSIEALAARFKLSRRRVRQILIGRIS